MELQYPSTVDRSTVDRSTKDGIEQYPLQAQDRGTKLYDAYCKYLLSYNGLSWDEKKKITQQVAADRLRVKTEEQEDDCVVKVTEIIQIK